MAASSDSDLQMITFSLDGATYGVSVDEVAEVLRMVEVQQLPQTPHWMAGMIDLRGAIAPIIDLRARLGMTQRPYALNTSIVVLRHGDDRHVGMIVDAIDDLVTVDRRQVEQRDGNPSLKGVARCDQQLIMLLDVAPITQDAMRALDS